MLDYLAEIGLFRASNLTLMFAGAGTSREAIPATAAGTTSLGLRTPGAKARVASLYLSWSRAAHLLFLVQVPELGRGRHPLHPLDRRFRHR